MLIDDNELMGKILETLTSGEIDKYFSTTYFAEKEHPEDYKQAMRYGMIIASMLIYKCKSVGNDVYNQIVGDFDKYIKAAKENRLVELFCTPGSEKWLVYSDCTEAPGMCRQEHCEGCKFHTYLYEKRHMFSAEDVLRYKGYHDKGMLFDTKYQAEHKIAELVKENGYG